MPRPSHGSLVGFWGPLSQDTFTKHHPWLFFLFIFYHFLQAYECSDLSCFHETLPAPDSQAERAHTSGSLPLGLEQLLCAKACPSNFLAHSSPAISLPGVEPITPRSSPIKMWHKVPVQIYTTHLAQSPYFGLKRIFYIHYALL